MQSLLVFIFFVFQVGCVTISQRQKEVVDLNLFAQQKPIALPSLLVFLYSDSLEPQRRFQWADHRLKNEVLTTLISTGWFSNIEFALPEERLRRPSLFLPKNEFASDYELSIYVRKVGYSKNIIQGSLAILTLTIIPAKEDFNYLVGFQLKKRNEQAVHDLILTEDYTAYTTIMPYFGRKTKADGGEKALREPIYNLIKAALLEYRKQGLLK